LRTPNARATSTSPIPENTPSKNGLLSFRERLASPDPSSTTTTSRSFAKPRLNSHPSAPPTVPGNNNNNNNNNNIANRRASLQPPKPLDFSMSETTRSTATTTS